MLTVISDEKTKELERTAASTSATPCLVLDFENPVVSLAPEGFKSASDFIQDLENDPSINVNLSEGRKWVRETFYGDDGVTIKTLRLGLGLSQVQLAQELSTSQSHIARIERGQDNFSIDTCRRLAHALKVDVNTISEALLRQKEQLAAK